MMVVTKFLLTLIGLNGGGAMEILYSIIGIAFIIFIMVTTYLILIQPLIDLHNKDTLKK